MTLCCFRAFWCGLTVSLWPCSLATIVSFDHEVRKGGRVAGGVCGFSCASQVRRCWFSRIG
jgi:hypothetical protein